MMSPTAARRLPERTLDCAAMGGTLTLRVATSQGCLAVDRDLAMVAARVSRWAGRLTRFDPRSELVRLNGSTGSGRVRVRPTLAALLERTQRLADRSGHLVDITLMPSRLAAEQGPADGARAWPGPMPWSLDERTRHGGVVVRGGEIRFDLDGVAKGWIADRALRMLRGHAAALVDADGDIAVRVPAGSPWEIAVADPREAESVLVRFSLSAAPHDRSFGVATSGTTVHRWPGPTGDRHHLIDPRTGMVAVTDLVQASVIADDAVTAEVLAKAAVIAGSVAGPALLERGGAWAAVLLLDDGRVLASPRTLAWLA